MKQFLLSTLFLAIATIYSPVTDVHADGYVPSNDSSSSTEPAARAKELDLASNQIRNENEGIAIEQADGEKLSIAVGHYARARSLMIAALREFDSGYKIAKPDAILNSKEWRSDLISRTEDLERILAPQARASKYGVKYDADPRLLNTEAK